MNSKTKGLKIDMDFIDQQVCFGCKNDMFWSRMENLPPLAEFQLTTYQCLSFHLFDILGIC